MINIYARSDGNDDDILKNDDDRMLLFGGNDDRTFQNKIMISLGEQPNRKPIKFQIPPALPQHEKVKSQKKKNAFFKCDCHASRFGPKG